MEEIYFHALTVNFEPPNKKILNLYKKYKSFKKIFEITEKEFKTKKDWEKEYQKLQEENIKIIIRKNLPKKLKIVREPILGLYYYGNFNQNNEPLSIAIVGTRRASNLGKNISYQFSQRLTQVGAVIISGLAYGIDEYAHKGSLSARGRTIAVIGCGLKTILKDPRKKIIEKILENNGMIISEYFPEATALPYHFPLRNRIIAGLSDGILIIEAPIDSGALITARFGLDLNKEIFVIPSDIYNKNYYGSLRLIQEGANLVIEPEDILRHFDFKLPQKIKNLSLSNKERKIIDSLKTGNLSITEIAEITKLPINEILALVSHLEIKGLILEENGKFYLNK
ncbi:MAG: DNA processing protein DprA [Candidatus Parcubacteria bacterium]|nr:MAG: DNA processing protein DprA [Candidatus Parcubacteria bacterium]